MLDLAFSKEILAIIEGEPVSSISADVQQAMLDAEVFLVSKDGNLKLSTEAKAWGQLRMSDAARARQIKLAGQAAKKAPARRYGGGHMTQGSASQRLLLMVALGFI